MIEAKAAGRPLSAFDGLPAPVAGRAMGAVGSALWVHVGPRTGGAAGVALPGQYIRD